MLLGGFMHGKVVDMFYFPMKWIHWPDWVPMIGGEEWLFFSPIFNVADAAITCGVLSIFLFQRHFFKQDAPTEPIGSIEQAEPSALIEQSEQDEPSASIEPIEPPEPREPIA